MKAWVITAILLINIILQSTLLPFVQIASVKPDTLIILVVSFALLAGSVTGALVGFFGGLIQDVLYGGSLGTNAFQYMIIGFVIGLVFNKVFVGKIILPVFFIFCGTLLRGFMMLVYLFFIRADIPFKYGFTVVILPEAIYTIVLAPLIFYGLSLLYQKRFMNMNSHFIN